MQSTYNLQLDRLAVNRNGAEAKVDANGANAAVLKLVVLLAGEGDAKKPCYANGHGNGECHAMVGGAPQIGARDSSFRRPSRQLGRACT